MSRRRTQISHRMGLAVVDEFEDPADPGTCPGISRSYLGAGTVWEMSAGRRYALVGVGAAVVWYVCVLFFWALQPLHDAVPVGIDYNLSPPAFVSVSVTCEGLFDGAARDASPLPALTPQPTPRLPLGFQREPCTLPHQQARVVFVLDTVLFLAVVLACGWFGLWRNRSPSAGPVNNDPRLVGMPAS